MLTETFEDERLHLIAEKVCHNPVVLAYHAEGDGWELYATSSGKTKFWGMFCPTCTRTENDPSFIVRQESRNHTSRDDTPGDRSRPL